VEDEVQAPPSRRRMWVAIAATCVAVPLLLFDNLSTDDDSPARPVATVATIVVPLDRPETGPVKGVSVVTSSTTSSTVPITANTTTTRP
jgi:hypothetical protein